LVGQPVGWQRAHTLKVGRHLEENIPKDL
jgi:hypothetical protein